MRHSTLAGIFLATSAFATSQISSASSHSTDPQACRLVSGSSPYPEISQYGTFGAGQFTNNSGGYAWTMCPVLWQDGAYNFMIATSNTNVSCYLIAVGVWGGGSTLYTPSSHSGNQYYFNAPLTAGSYTAEIQCWVPNGTSIWGILNY